MDHVLMFDGLTVHQIMDHNIIDQNIIDSDVGAQGYFQTRCGRLDLLSGRRRNGPDRTPYDRRVVVVVRTHDKAGRPTARQKAGRNIAPRALCAAARCDARPIVTLSAESARPCACWS
jgi:hypothetical protein